MDKLAYDLTLPQPTLDVRPMTLEMHLGLLRGKSPVFDQPTERHRGTAGPAGLAVDINHFALVDVPLHEFHRPLDILQFRRGEVRRRHMQLLDAIPLILLDRAEILLTSIHDRRDALAVQSLDVPAEGAGAEDHLRIDRVPPIPYR